MTESAIWTRRYLKRAQAVRENRKGERKGSCGHKLAADNDGPLCSPCHRKFIRENPHKKPPRKKQSTVKVPYAARREHFYLRGLQRIMDEQGIANRELSRRTNIGRDTIGNYKYTRSRCHPDRAEMIAEALGVSVEDLK